MSQTEPTSIPSHPTLAIVPPPPPPSAFASNGAPILQEDYFQLFGGLLNSMLPLPQAVPQLTEFPYSLNPPNIMEGVPLDMGYFLTPFAPNALPETHMSFSPKPPKLQKRGSIDSTISCHSNGSSVSGSTTSQRQRQLLTSEQKAALKKVYAESHFPDNHVKEELCRTLNLPIKRIHIWFQNQRQYHRLKNKKRGSQQWSTAKYEHLRRLSCPTTVHPSQFDSQMYNWNSPWPTPTMMPTTFNNA